MAAEAEERKAERKYKLEMKRLQLERERLVAQRRASSEELHAPSSQASQESVVARTKASALPGFLLLAWFCTAASPIWIQIRRARFQRKLWLLEHKHVVQRSQHNLKHSLFISEKQQQAIIT